MTALARQLHDLADPARIADVPAAELPSIVLQLAAVQAALAARLQQLTSSSASASDRMLTIEDAASRTGMSKAWLYRHHHSLAFARKIGRKIVFSEAGLARWLARR